MYLIDVIWDNQSKIPSLLYRESEDLQEDKEFPLEYDSPITFRLKDKKYCIGYIDYDKEKRVGCPNNASILDAKYNQCYSCRAKEVSHIIDINALSIKEQEGLKKYPYLNYINLFPADIVKTGVASVWREHIRILEQGAIMSMYFASSDGLIARQIENFVSSNLDIRQAVRWDTKLADLVPSFDSNQQETQLMDMYEKLTGILPDDLKQYILKKPKIYNNVAYYKLDYLNSVDKFHYIKSIKPGDCISGQIKGIYGKILLLLNSNKLFAINLQSLSGISLDMNNEMAEQSFSDTPKEITLRGKAKQMNLFGL
ncbi:DUF2797 domain-containing protein [Candidatus Dojkabacteria bacterium]|nr:DUF2797 domain-containing protein [Candidatus Dojkabacteria bacterium]